MQLEFDFKIDQAGDFILNKLSVLEDIECEVKSVFDHVANIKVINDNLGFSLIDKSVIMAPYHLRIKSHARFSIKKLALKTGMKVKLTKKEIIFPAKNIHLDFSEAVGWESCPQVKVADKHCENKHQLSIFKDALLAELLENGSLEGLGGIYNYLRGNTIYCNSASNSKNYLLRVALQSLESFLVAEDKSEKDKCLIKLIGLGPGLTPAGDDFLTGWACGEKIGMTTPDYTIRNFLQRVSFSNLTTFESGIQLQAAAEGGYNEYLIKLVEKLNNNVTEIRDSAYNLQKIGSSSGSDMLSGLIWSIFMYITNEMRIDL